MLTSYFYTAVQSFVVICLATNVTNATLHMPPPPATIGERLCRAHINDVFKTLTDARSCSEYAFLHLRDNAPEFTEHIAAEMYYNSLKLFIRPGLIHTPEEFCDEYSRGRSSDSASTSAATIRYTKVSKQTCTRILMDSFLVPIITYQNLDTMMQRIIDHVYANESINVEHYQRSNPLSFNELNQEFIDTVANYVMHVSERFVLDGETPNPIDFCHDPIFEDITIFTLNT